MDAQTRVGWFSTLLCGISKTVRDRAQVTIITNRKSHGLSIATKVDDLERQFTAGIVMRVVYRHVT